MTTKVLTGICPECLGRHEVKLSDEVSNPTTKSLEEWLEIPPENWYVMIEHIDPVTNQICSGTGTTPEWVE